MHKIKYRGREFIYIYIYMCVCVCVLQSVCLTVIRRKLILLKDHTQYIKNNKYIIL